MKYRLVTIRMNGNRKPVDQISDRAKRYRANQKGFRPGAPKQCNFCGNRKNIGVGHVDGDESHGEPENLIWTCKSCNAKAAHLMKNAGIGRRVVQRNKSRGGGSRRGQLKAYGDAIKVMRGEFDGNVAAAVATIHATPASIRSEYTSRSWPTRRQLYGPSGRQGELPF